MKNSISKISLFFFIFLYSYFPLRILLFPHLYDNYGSFGLIIGLIVFLILLSIFIVIPKKILSLNHSFEKSYIKNIIKPLLLAKITLSIYFSSYVLKVLYFTEFNVLYIALGLVLAILIISRGKTSDVVSVSTIFGIVALFSYVFYFYDLVSLDYSLLTKIKEFNYFTFFYILFFIIDFLLLLLVDEGVRINKLTIILGVLLSMLLFLFEFFILTLSAGDKLFLNVSTSGFIPLMIEPVSRYMGTFEYVSIIGITLSVIFKNSYYLSIIGNNSKGISIGFGILIYLVIIGYTFILKDLLDVRFIAVIITLLLGLIIPWIIKEAYHARLAKE